MTTSLATAKYVFTLVKERNYDSDLGREQRLGSVVLDVDPSLLDQPERQLLELIRASGILDDEIDEDAADYDYADESGEGATYYIDATPVVEVADIREAAADLIQRNRWLSELRQS